MSLQMKGKRSHKGQRVLAEGRMFLQKDRVFLNSDSVFFTGAMSSGRGRVFLQSDSVCVLQRASVAVVPGQSVLALVGSERCGSGYFFSHDPAPPPLTPTL